MDSKRTEPTQAAASAPAATDETPSPAASAAAVKDAQTVAEGSFLSPGRRLSTSNCTFDPSHVADFEDEVKADNCDVIELESGTYDISATLVINRTLTIQAKTPAPIGNPSSVVLDGGKDNSFYVDYVVRVEDFGGKVSLNGLCMTNGKVCAPRAFLGTDGPPPILPHTPIRT